MLFYPFKSNYPIMRIYLLLFTCFFLCLPIIFAQKKELKVKFGKISEAEIKMKDFADDLAAPAVILFDKGTVTNDFNSQTGFVLRFEHHKRIKIFKKDAYEMANIQIFYFKWQRIQDLKAVCYNQENGKTEEVELKKDNIFNETLTKNRLVKKFTIPGVKEGSIIEFQYDIVDENSVSIPDWTFQDAFCPTIWSEFQAEIPTFISFKKMYHGWTPFLLTEEEEQSRTININYTDRVTEGQVTRSSINTAKVDYRYQRLHFIQEKVPALKPEKYVNSHLDYVSQINFDIRAVFNTSLNYAGSSYQIVNGSYKEYNNNWQKLGEEIYEDIYESPLKSSKFTEDDAKVCTSGKTEILDKVAAIYEFIGKNYQSNDMDYIWMTKSFEQIIKDKKGTNTELNILLINMLRQIGITANPVLISTTDNGRVNPFRISIEAFNRTIVMVTIDEKNKIFVDLSDYSKPIGFLPTDALNGEGLFISKDMGVDFIEVLNKQVSRTAYVIEHSVKETGEMTGNVTYAENGYGTIDNRLTLKEKNVEAVIGTAFSAWKTDGTFSDISVENTEQWNDPVMKVLFKDKISGYSNVSGGKIFFSPTLGLGINENPFKNPERKFNIDFGVPHDETFVFTFNIPTGYKVEEFPPSTKIIFGDNAIQFEYLS
jgi:Domain of Unknown Function with PDB structure (DUF3857)/Transglutaminase-like superfamily